MDELIQRALIAARETHALLLGHGVLREAAALFRHHFGEARAIIVSDPESYAAAGARVAAIFSEHGISCDPAFQFTDPGFYAEHEFVEDLTSVLRATNAIPVAVGAGSVNDVTKLAAHRCERPYMVVATAASMDGYTAFGASISYLGSKQTFSCPAPRVVLADIEVAAAAPASLSAGGYADLAAKITAGADWIIADDLGIEPIDETAWNLVQARLRNWLSDPSAVRAGDPDAIGQLLGGLMLGGFAMQWMQSSRCASGAEHQFSHLWDMEGHTFHGATPSHGFKVGVATLAITRLYERLLEQPLDQLDIELAVRSWPTWAEVQDYIQDLYNQEEIVTKALEEAGAKHLTSEQVRAHLIRLREIWPRPRERLRAQLIPSAALERMLIAVGAPTRPEEIGISPARLEQAHWQAALIRRRFTVLDLALITGELGPSLDELYP